MALQINTTTKDYAIWKHIPGLLQTRLRAEGGYAGSLTTKTDASHGVVTLTSAYHAITTGATISLWWDGGKRLSMTVGTVSGTTIPVSGGTGDDLPDADTVVVGYREVGWQIGFRFCLDAFNSTDDFVLAHFVNGVDATVTDYLKVTVQQNSGNPRIATQWSLNSGDGGTVYCDYDPGTWATWNGGYNPAVLDGSDGGSCVFHCRTSTTSDSATVLGYEYKFPASLRHYQMGRAYLGTALGTVRYADIWSSNDGPTTAIGNAFYNTTSRDLATALAAQSCTLTSHFPLKNDLLDTVVTTGGGLTADKLGLITAPVFVSDNDLFGSGWSAPTPLPMLRNGSHLPLRRPKVNIFFFGDSIGQPYINRLTPHLVNELCRTTGKPLRRFFRGSNHADQLAPPATSDILIGLTAETATAFDGTGHEERQVRDGEYYELEHATDPENVYHAVPVQCYREMYSGTITKLAHWPLQDDGEGDLSVDELVSSLTSTISGEAGGAATLSTNCGAGPGTRYAKGFKLAGDNDYINVTDKTLFLAASSKHTLACWFKKASNPLAEQNMVSVSTNAGTGRATLLITTNGSVKAYGRGTDTDTVNSATSASSGYCNDQWHHAAAVFDLTTGTSGSITIYVDGVATAATNVGFDATATANTTPLYLTIGSIGTSSYLNGNISDVRIYSGALTEDNIKTIMAEKDTLSPSNSCHLEVQATNASHTGSYGTLDGPLTEWLATGDTVRVSPLFYRPATAANFQATWVASDNGDNAESMTIGGSAGYISPVTFGSTHSYKDLANEGDGAGVRSLKIHADGLISGKYLTYAGAVFENLSHTEGIGAYWLAGDSWNVNAYLVDEASAGNPSDFKKFTDEQVTPWLAACIEPDVPNVIVFNLDTEQPSDLSDEMAAWKERWTPLFTGLGGMEPVYLLVSQPAHGYVPYGMSSAQFWCWQFEKWMDAIAAADTDFVKVSLYQLFGGVFGHPGSVAAYHYLDDYGGMDPNSDLATHPQKAWITSAYNGEYATSPGRIFSDSAHPKNFASALMLAEVAVSTMDSAVLASLGQKHLQHQQLLYPKIG